MPRSVLIVYTNCSDPARDAEFNDWYNNIHIPDVLSVQGFTACTRYKLTEHPQDGEATYLAVYKIDSDNPDAAMAELRGRVAEWRERNRIIDCLKLVSAKTFKRVGS